MVSGHNEYRNSTAEVGGNGYCPQRIKRQRSAWTLKELPFPSEQPRTGCENERRVIPVPVYRSDESFL